MAHTFVSLLVHLVFSTKHRENLITPEIEPELFAYISGILKNLGSTCLEINGTGNHLHALYSHNKNVALSDTVMEVKKSSSKWIKSKGRFFRHFSWQQGYGAFTIGQSAVAAVRRYIRNQKERHKRRTFEDEFIALLRKYQVPFDPRYIWD